MGEEEAGPQPDPTQPPDESESLADTVADLNTEGREAERSLADSAAELTPLKKKVKGGSQGHE